MYCSSGNSPPHGSRCQSYINPVLRRRRWNHSLQHLCSNSSRTHCDKRYCRRFARDSSGMCIRHCNIPQCPKCKDFRQHNHWNWHRWIHLQCSIRPQCSIPHHRLCHRSCPPLFHLFPLWFLQWCRPSYHRWYRNSRWEHRNRIPDCRRNRSSWDRRNSRYPRTNPPDWSLPPDHTVRTSNRLLRNTPENNRHLPHHMFRRNRYLRRGETYRGAGLHNHYPRCNTRHHHSHILRHHSCLPCRLCHHHNPHRRHMGEGVLRCKPG